MTDTPTTPPADDEEPPGYWIEDCEDGTCVIWSRPSAHAYALVCKARDQWQARAEAAERERDALALANGDYKDNWLEVHARITRLEEARRKALTAIDAAILRERVGLPEYGWKDIEEALHEARDALSDEALKEEPPV